MQLRRSALGLATWGLVAAIVLILPGATARGGEDAKKVNDSEIAIGGFCPVSYQTEVKAVKGDPALAVEYQGFVYNCANAEAKKRFEADPAKYVPKYGGLCTTSLGGSYGNRNPSDPEVFYVIDGALYLFSSVRARNAFDRWPDEYIAKANDLYKIPALNGYCPVSYFKSGKVAKGDAKYSRTYKGVVYHFADEEAAKAFEKESNRFLPQYEGFCAEGMSRGKSYPGDPKSFEIIDGKSYFFYDESAKKTFVGNAKELIAKADSGWNEYKDTRAKEQKEKIDSYRKMTMESRQPSEPAPVPEPPVPAPSKP